MVAVKKDCSTCAHCDLCIYKPVMKMADEAIDQCKLSNVLGRSTGTKIRELPFLKPIELDCKHYLINRPVITVDGEKPEITVYRGE